MVSTFLFQHQVGTQKLIRQVGIWEKQCFPNKQTTRHTDEVRPLGLSGRPPGEPATQDDCAHFVGQVTQAQGAADARKVVAACGLAQDKQGEGSRVRADTLG